MRYIIITSTFLVSLCVANLVEKQERESLLDLNYHPNNHRVHSHRRHHKRDYKLQCGHGNCPDDTFFVYYKCCRSVENQCCWYLRMWVIVVFGALLLKAFLACFVSFFRCVCC